MPNSTTFLPSKPAEKYPFHLQVTPSDLRKHPICPSAVATIFDQEDQACTHLFATCCKRWGCAYCSRRKISQLAVRTAAAKPTRLLTLTVDPQFFSSPKHAWEQTAKKIPDLAKALRAQFGEVEYLRVTELHKSGYPHYHLLVRSGFLPHASVRDSWAKLTGAKIVDLRPVDQNWRAYWYLTKYLAKLHSKSWTERHVSYSRGFFPKECTTPPRDSSIKLRERSHHHPYRWLYDHCHDSTVVALQPHHWTIEVVEFPLMNDVTNWELGIPLEGTADAPKQRTMTSPDEP